jgi:hypothetical protein
MAVVRQDTPAREGPPGTLGSHAPLAPGGAARDCRLPAQFLGGTQANIEGIP